MNRLKHLCENYNVRGVFAIIIIFGLIFVNALLPLPLNISSQEQNPSPDKLVDNGSHIAIPRLMNHLNSLLNHTNEFSSDLTSSNQESTITPSLKIGNQIGTGSGVYQAYDSANLTSSMNLVVDDNHWRMHPEEHENSQTITIPTGYTNQSGYFNISGVTALPDWRLVENATSGATNRPSNSFLEAAQEFTVGESDLNLTKVYLYIDMIDDNDTDNKKPNGEFLVVGDNSGEPDPTDIKGTFTLETHSTLAGLSDGGGWSASTNGWLQYSFSPALHLTQGTYWLLLNDTGEGGDGWWGWYTQDDGGDNPDKGEWNYKVLSHSGVWTEGNNLDMVIMPQVLSVELINSNYLNKKYTSPKSLNFTYQTSEDSTKLSSFTWFEWNGTSDNILYFLTNTSVNFTISWRINITYSNNPLPITASYLTVNNSMRSQWNLTFTTASITTSYNIRNRTITVTGLEDDWNGSSISHGGLLEYNTTPSGGLNASVIYSNQSTPMIINASTLAAATDWNITFDAPNYVLGFNISLRGTPLGLPYQTFTMNDYYLDFKVGETGNLTYWIDYPNGSQRLKYNINNTHTVFHDLWDIDNTFDNISNVNGTYYLQAFWNNSDSSKVGTYTREVSMIVNTTFNYEYETEIILDTYLNITVYYNSTHNTTVINNANVSGVPSWGTGQLVEFNHTSAYDPYTFSLEINDSQHDPGDTISVDIYAELPGYVSNSTIINVKVVANATLNTDISQNFVLEWRENRTIEIKYNRTGGSGVDEATIAVDGDSTNVYNISNVYYYRFNSTKYGGVGTYLNLDITASHPNYLTRMWYFNLTITPGYTNITGSFDGEPLDNDTTVVTQYFANSSADIVTINLQYYHNLTGDDLETSPPTIVSPIPIYNTIKDENDLSWNITFNPNETGVFLIYITFYLNNYKNSTFFFHLTVDKAGTAIENAPSVDTPVYYAEYYDFFLLFNNTNYDENITGLIEGSGFTINNSKADDLNQTDEGYWFRFNPSPSILPLGRHAINITFFHEDFNTSYIEVTFVIIPRPTNITGTDADDGAELTNNTSTYYRHYSPGSYDNFSIWLRYYVNRSGTTLNVSDINNIEVDSSIKVSYWKDLSSFNWTFIFNGSLVGTYSINITFHLTNYTYATFILYYVIQKADTNFSAESIQPSPSQTEIVIGDTLDFWIVWQSEYGEYLNDSNGVESNSTYVTFLNSNPITGNHSFSFTAPGVGTETISLTFSTASYNNLVFIVRFTILPAPTILGETTYANNSILGQSPLLYYTETLNFNITWVETISNSSVIDPEPVFTGNGSDFNFVVSWVSLENGTQNCTIQGKRLGLYELIIDLETINYSLLRYVVYINVSIMPTKPLNIANIRYNQSILIEDVLYISGEGYQTEREQNISNLDTVFLLMNDTPVSESLYDFKASQNWFTVNFTTTTYHYGNYSLTLEIGKDGYQNQHLSFNVTLLGRKTILEVTLPGKTLEQGEPIKITANLTYAQDITGGIGAGISLAPLDGVNVSFYIELKYGNETTRMFETTSQTDVLGQANFIIDSKYTRNAIGFSNITVQSGPALSGLPSSYSMSTKELAEYKIIKIIDPLEIIIPVIIMGAILLLFVGAVVSSGIVLNRKRKQRSAVILQKRRKIEESFEDIKSIRLLIARHESGLQFYSEKTIAEMQTDTDALSGMSAALSSFMEEISEGMRSRTEEDRKEDKIEVMSREGLHMLIWHGKFSSFIIISEARLPDYFQDRLKKLGNEVETKYAQDLMDFYRSDQIPSTQIKKMVRKHIPLHYFSAFVLNEGVLTLESIKLSRKEKKMLDLIKEIRFQKEGIQFFFSEQIISHLSKHYNRSEAIKFLDQAIEINLLIEASQEDIISIGK